MNTECKNKLIANAVPTIFDIPNPPKRVTLKRPKKKREIAAKKCETSSTSKDVTLNDLLAFNEENTEWLSPGEETDKQEGNEKVSPTIKKKVLR